jgi:mono/diheme cytochrome c family protein
MNENQPQNFDDTDLDRLHAAVKREKPEVQPGRELISAPTLVVAFVLTLLGGGYLGAYTHVSGFSFDQTSAFAGRPEDPRPVIIGPGADLDPFQFAMKKGSSVYNNCIGCHMPTGMGQPGLVPPLAGSEWVMGGTERIARIAMHGLVGPVTVKGMNFNNAMVPPPMSDTEISQVLTYVRNSFGNQAPMVTKEMVSKVRAATSSHSGQWTAPLLEPFADKNIPGEIPAGPGATAAPVAAPAPPAK